VSGVRGVSDGDHDAPARPRRREVSVTERERRIAQPQAQVIIRRTRELIYEQGISAANVREIARRSKITSGPVIWYFGTKGRLLVEVLGHDHAERLTLLRSGLEAAGSRAELVEAVHGVLGAFVDERSLRGSSELIAEVTRLAIDDEDVAARRGELRREYREVLARLLGDKQQAGIVSLRGHATSVAGLLISLAQGFAVEMTADRGWRAGEAIRDSRIVVETLLCDPVS
jgi:AcrR family transcriptional regulator